MDEMSSVSSSPTSTKKMSSVSSSPTSKKEMSSQDRLDKVTDSLENFSFIEKPSEMNKENESTTESYEVHNVNNNKGIKCSDKVEVNDTEQNTFDLNIKDHMKKQLELLECPFSWKVTNEHTRRPPDVIISQIVEKMEEIVEEDIFQWRTFTLNLVLCYEHFYNGNFCDAMEKQRTCHRIVTAADSKGNFEDFYQATKDALLHVVLSCKYYLAYESGVYNELNLALENVLKYEEMDNPCKAAIWGIRAAVSMEYGYEGTKAAVEHTERALELDPEQGEWHFLLGKCLGRIRRVENYNEIPTKRELKALEKAVEITNNPSYIIFLAQAYREAAFRVFSIKRNNLGDLKEYLDKMNKRSSDLYREALRLRGDCAHINVRCAQGFSKLPIPFRDVKQARECCDKALALAPNNAMVSHVAGSIYERYEGDLEKAKKYYEAAGQQGAFGGYMDLYKLKYVEDNKYNPIPDFESLLTQYTEKPRAEETLLQMGSYYLFIKDDLVTAYREYWDRVIKLNPESDRLKTHKCIFLRMKTPVNVYEVMLDEARLAIENKRFHSDKDHKLCRQIIIDISKKFPDLLQKSPQPRRKMAWDETTSLNYGRSRSQRGRGRGRGREGFRGRGRAGGSRNRGGNRRSQSREDGRGRGKGRGNNRGSYSRNSNRDSSTESRGSNRGGYYNRIRSRDSSVDSKEGHNSKGRNFDSSWRNRDSSNESRSSADKNWRAGPRDFCRAEDKLDLRRDSSNSSVDSRQGCRAQDQRYNNWKYENQRSRTDNTSIVRNKSTYDRAVDHRHNNKKDDENCRTRTNSASNIGSASDLPKTWERDRRRTESNSSVGSDTYRGWRHEGRDKNNQCMKSDDNWRAYAGSKLEFSQGGRQFNNDRDLWKNAGDGRQGFQRGRNRGKGEGRGYSKTQHSGNSNSSLHFNRREGDIGEGSELFSLKPERPSVHQDKGPKNKF